LENSDSVAFVNGSSTNSKKANVKLYSLADSTNISGLEILPNSASGV
jgi:hypothetical protein